ncbi:GumC family protein [Afifella marina]|uniref:Uncharacterized protein involved in exopolysaccharide biosynthesis n=1 Tax=Afifella marina DSM 2698 TaxID=1120955 RepID=A0A1G5NTF6_AFIMA|nr:hypothetical protein [Afifella marina]MBK1624156.1 hypothetical protein [Afifella marina DSM 2698]MBK1627713.1 hypothetical protein [Afifella marina]MBK5916437.1 hypothetical protein [Afifella marina]RAI20988.1 hypothetical protein CH311_08670 [Afifella marina DSM 2698]SCZ40615.1 Uncharacterized protein involved in exopolysaccharide biosynthesis [Afifella marina DSM 2698]
MNVHTNRLEGLYSPHAEEAAGDDARTGGRHLFARLGAAAGGISRFMPRLTRTRITALSPVRLLRGGRVGDFQRLPRYALVIFAGLAAIWAPVILYISTAPLRFQSEAAMIMPGAGSSSSVNLSDIGQASTSASSPYSSSSISPTVTYKSLIESRRVLERAAGSLQLEVQELGRPRIKLLDQTSLIRLSMTGSSPEEAADKTEAILAAFLGELDQLRSDEMESREISTIDTVREHQKAVEAIRLKISALQAKTGLASADQHLELVTMIEQMGQQVVSTTSELRESEEAVVALSTMLNVDADNASSMLRLHGDIEFAALSENAAEASAKLSSLSGRFGQSHPQVVEARNNYKGAKARMDDRAQVVTGLPVVAIWEQIDPSSQGERSALLSQLVDLVAKRDGLAARVAALKQEHEAGKERVRDLVETASRLDSLNRDYKVAEAVFASALARMNTTRNDVFASYPMVQVIEQPSIEWEPSSPNKKIALGAAGAGSLFLLMGLALAWMRRPLIDRLLENEEAGDENADATA